MTVVQTRMTLANVTLGEVHIGIKVFVAMLGLPLLVISIAGNGFLLLVIYRQRTLQNSHFVFISNLALVAILMSVSGLPYLIVDLVLEHRLVSSSTHCQLSGFGLYLSGVVSTQSLFFISFSRYMNVCHNPTFRKVFSYKKNVFTCGLTWLVSLTLTAPLLDGRFSYGYDARLHMCSVSTTQEPSGGHVVFVLSLMVLPSVWTCFFNFRIFWFWRRSKQRLVRRDLSKSSRTARRETQTALVSASARAESRYPPLDTDDIPVSVLRAWSTRLSPRRAARSIWRPEEVHGVSAKSDVEKSLSPFDDHTSARNDPSSWSRLTGVGSVSAAQLRRCRKGLRVLRRFQRSNFNVFEDHGHDRAPSTQPACCSSSSPLSHQDRSDEDSLVDTLNAEEDFLVKSLVLSLHPDFIDDCWYPASMSDTSLAVLLSARPVDATSNDDELRTTSDSRATPATPATAATSTTKPKTTATTTTCANVLVTRCERRLINVLLAVTVSVLFLQSPFGVCVLLDFLVPVPADVKVCAALLLFTSSSITWIIYGAMNTCLNKPFKDAFKSCCFL